MTKVKFLLLFIVSLFFRFEGTAQMDFKIQIGPQLSKFRTNVAAPKKLSFYKGFSADAIMIFRTDKKLQIETGVGINQKGWVGGKKLYGKEGTILDGLTYTKDTNHSNHLELPFQLNFFIRQPSEGFYLFGGIRPSYQLGYWRTTYTKEQPKLKEKFEFTPEDRYNALARLGLGYEFSITNFGITISSYFEQELIDGSKLKNYNIYDYSMGILVGIRF